MKQQQVVFKHLTPNTRLFDQLLKILGIGNLKQRQENLRDLNTIQKGFDIES